MRWLTRLLYTLFLVLILAIIALYFTMQTAIGASYISQWVSSQIGYRISASKINYIFPLGLSIEDLTLADGQSTLISSQTTQLDFAFLSRFQWPRLQTVILQQGTLTLNQNSLAALPIKIERLQLKKMSLNWSDPQWQLTGTEIDAGIAPWAPTTERLLAKESQFTVSAGKVDINGISVNNLLLAGSTEQGLLVLHDVGADIAQGTVTGMARQKSDSSWLINNIHFGNIRWQTASTLPELWRLTDTWPPIQIERFDLLNSRIEGKGWALNDFNLILNQILLQQGKLITQQGSANISAGNIVVNSTTLKDPVVRLAFSPVGIEISEFSTYWQEGLIRGQGQWLRHNSELQLSRLEIAALEYTLPRYWYQWWQKPLPAWLNRLSINNLIVNRNLIIGIDPVFPFQITQLNGHGNQILLINKGKIGLWQGALTLNAFNATLNKVEIRRPTLKLQTENQQLNLKEFSALTEQGLLEAKGHMALTAAQHFNLTLTGQSVDLSLLKQWGWGKESLPSVGSLQLQLTGEAAATTPFRKTLQGNLQAESEKERYQQVMQEGVVTSQ